MGRLDGKCAFVTAAGDGIGRAVAIALAQEGARVCATSRRASSIEPLQEHGVKHVVGLDVTVSEAVEQSLSSVASLDIVVNCAGLVLSDRVDSCSSAALEQAISVNLFGAFHVTKTAVPKMLENGGGSIVNIASIISSLKGAPDRFSYGTTKGALIGMTKSIACDIAHAGIRCNAICPGTIETPSLQQRIASAGDPERERRKYLARHPLGSMGRPDQVAALAVHLASDEAGFTTGQTIVVDGGWTA